MKKSREIFCKVCKHWLCLNCGEVVGAVSNKFASKWSHKCLHNKKVYPE